MLNDLHPIQYYAYLLTLDRKRPSTYDPKLNDQSPPLPSTTTTTASPHKSPTNTSSDSYSGSAWVSNYSAASPCTRCCISARLSDSRRCSGRSLGVFAQEALVDIWARGRRIYGRCCSDEKACTPFLEGFLG